MEIKTTDRSTGWFSKTYSLNLTFALEPDEEMSDAFIFAIKPRILDWALKRDSKCKTVKVEVLCASASQFAEASLLESLMKSDKHIQGFVSKASLTDFWVRVFSQYSSGLHQFSLLRGSS